MSGDKGMNKLMKAMGRNMARAHNQDKGIKGYASGGCVEGPRATNPVSIKTMNKSGLEGGGKARGTGAQTKNKSFGGIS